MNRLLQRLAGPDSSCSSDVENCAPPAAAVPPPTIDARFEPATRTTAAATPVLYKEGELEKKELEYQIASLERTANDCFARFVGFASQHSMRLLRENLSVNEKAQIEFKINEANKELEGLQEEYKKFLRTIKLHMSVVSVDVWTHAGTFEDYQTRIRQQSEKLAAAQPWKE